MPSSEKTLPELPEEDCNIANELEERVVHEIIQQERIKQEQQQRSMVRRVKEKPRNKNGYLTIITSHKRKPEKSKSKWMTSQTMQNLHQRCGNHLNNILCITCCPLKTETN